jgi:hypothetical protein
VGARERNAAPVHERARTWASRERRQRSRGSLRIPQGAVRIVVARSSGARTRPPLARDRSRCPRRDGARQCERARDRRKLDRRHASRSSGSAGAWAHPCAERGHRRQHRGARERRRCVRAARFAGRNVELDRRRWRVGCTLGAAGGRRGNARRVAADHSVPAHPRASDRREHAPAARRASRAAALVQRLGRAVGRGRVRGRLRPGRAGGRLAVAPGAHERRPNRALVRRSDLGLGRTGRRRSARA